VLFFTFFFTLMLHASAQGVFLHIGASHWCWWFSIFMLWVWVLFFKLVCCRPPLLVCCHFFSFVTLQIFLLLQLVGVVCRPIFLVVLLCFWLLPFGHRHGCGHFLVFLVEFLLVITMAMVIFLCSSWPSLWSWSSSYVLSCLLLAMVMVIFLCY
jgi:hypothetical protein